MVWTSMGGVDTWVRDQTNFLKSQVSLTAFRSIKAGANFPGTALATAATNDAAMVGGGVSNAAATYKVFASSIYQTPKTTAWGLCFRSILPAPVSGKANYVGIVNAAGTHDVLIGTVFATSATNYIISIDGGASTTVDSGVSADGLIHTLAITFDVTTVRIWKDGVQMASTATLTNLADEPMFPAEYGTDVGVTKTQEILYGYIAP